jgi:hypothetical protein
MSDSFITLLINDMRDQKTGDCIKRFDGKDAIDARIIRTRMRENNGNRQKKTDNPHVIILDVFA